jgi:outer membrane receptor for ferrienterochelin and colicin
MHRTKILILVLALLAPASAGAEEEEVKDFEGIEDFKEFDLEKLADVVFTAAKHEQDIAESPAAVTVISREQIENTACTDIICLLRQVPEVDVVRVVPMWASVGARALTNELGDKALVLIDGREINIEVFGVPFWLSLPVHLQDIERIEVVRGPGSALYGANAHSMVVSINTRPAAGDTAEAFAGGGEHGQLDLHARVDQTLGNWRLQVAGGHETTGHWRIRDRQEREISRVRLRLDHQTDSGLSNLQLSFCDLEGRLSVLRTPGDFRDALTADLQLMHQTDFLRAQVSAMLLNGDVYLDFPLFFRGARLGWEHEPLQAFSSNLDAAVDLTLEPFAGNLLITGGNYRWITFLSDQNDPATTHQHRVGVFLHDEQRLGDSLVLTAGVRLDINSITPSTLSPRLAGVWRLAASQSIRAAFGQAFRKPSFLNTSLHMNNYRGAAGFEFIETFFKKSIGNPDLENESITTLEVGYNGRFLDDRLVVEGDVFYNRYRDTINLHVEFVTDEFGMPDLQNSILEFRNTGLDADSVGGSVSLTLRVSDSLVLNGNYTLRHSWYVSDSRYDYQGVRKKKGDRVAWEPAHLLNLSFRYLTGMGLRLGVSFHGESSKTQEIFGGGPFETPVEMDLPPFCLINAFISWRVTMSSRWVEAGVRAFNVLHTGFRDRPAILRLDGVEAGGELIGRRIFLFLRARI